MERGSPPSPAPVPGGEGAERVQKFDELNFWQSLNQFLQAAQLPQSQQPAWSIGTTEQTSIGGRGPVPPDAMLGTMITADRTAIAASATTIRRNIALPFLTSSSNTRTARPTEILAYAGKQGLQQSLNQPGRVLVRRRTRL
jgi:hypothetical protein